MRIDIQAPPPSPIRDAAVQFEALLFKEAFAPLAKAMGFFGDSVVTAASQAMLRAAGSARDPLAAALESAGREAALR